MHNIDVDLRYLHHLLVDRMKLKRRPVAISYGTHGPPPGYEAVDVVACSIVRPAESGRRASCSYRSHGSIFAIS